MVRFPVTVLLLALAPIASAASISDGELCLGGVALGDTESHVLSVLGRPRAEVDTGEGVAFEYQGLTVSVGWLQQPSPDKQRQVLQLDATSPAVCTPSNICPGSSLAAVISAYGKPEVAERESGRFLEYYSSQSSCWLRLSASDITIRSISVVCQP
jgi:hypothetical protein